MCRFEEAADLPSVCNVSHVAADIGVSAPKGSTATESIADPNAGTGVGESPRRDRAHAAGGTRDHHPLAGAVNLHVKLHFTSIGR